MRKKGLSIPHFAQAQAGTPEEIPWVVWSCLLSQEIHPISIFQKSLVPGLGWLWRSLSLFPWSGFQSLHSDSAQTGPALEQPYSSRCNGAPSLKDMILLGSSWFRLEGLNLSLGETMDSLPKCNPTRKEHMGLTKRLS